jgi:hypothetical protein
MACPNVFDLDEGESLKIFQTTNFFVSPSFETHYTSFGWFHSYVSSFLSPISKCCMQLSQVFFMLICSWGLAFVVANSHFD